LISIYSVNFKFKFIFLKDKSIIFTEISKNLKMGSGCCKASPSIDSEFDNLILNVS